MGIRCTKRTKSGHIHELYGDELYGVLVGILSFWFEESFNESIIIDLDLNLGNPIQYLHFRNGD